ncbi:MAG TPA: metallophosphoesterase family protein [Gemmataceae bacterium]|nr:metallophosphoesterase family protein [Gemmataceae bacterium]
MRTLVIGDIHGCLTALRTLLEVVAPASDDRLIALGDYVDRGPDSRGVLDLLIALRAEGRLVPLRGNHDEMMTEARIGAPADRSLWLACGGQETLQSYGVKTPERSDLKEIPDSHWDFLERDCLDWYETPTHFFVHANAYADLPLDDQPRYMLLWEKLYAPCRHVSGKIMVCGHTKQPDGQVRNYGSTICIDTGAYAPNGWLTCLDVDTGRLWQTNQKGEKRDGQLGEAQDVDF